MLKINGYLSIIGLILIFLTACSSRVNIQFTSDLVLNKINKNSVTIVVYYYMEEEEFRKRLSTFKGFELLKKSGNLHDLQIIIPIEQEHKDLKVLAYIGSGTLLKDNHIISVKHLFDQAEDTVGMKIWVFSSDNRLKLTEADLVAVSESDNSWDDYAVIKTREDLNCEGARIVKANSTKRGDKIVVVGSTGGIAFFTRFGYATIFENFLKKIENGLTLDHYEEFPYWCIYPGGPGDSGGSIRDIKGNLISVLYCGIEIYSEEYIFANPTKMLWDFLEKNNLRWIGEREFPSSEIMEEKIAL